MKQRALISILILLFTLFFTSCAKKTSGEKNIPLNRLPMDENLILHLEKDNLQITADPPTLTTHEVYKLEWDSENYLIRRNNPENQQAPMEEILSLKGLEYLIKIEKIQLRGHNLPDISPLSSLFQLEVLTLEDCQITEIEPLASLTNLIELDLSVNKIEDLTGLEALNYLNQLNLRNNEIVEMDSISSLIQLKWLDISGNPVNDLGFLRDYHSMMHLNIRNTEIDDIGILADWENLEYLNIDNTKVVDINPLSTISSLRDLTLSHQYQIEDFSPIFHLKNLETVRLPYHPDVNLDYTQLVQLEKLVKIILLYPKDSLTPQELEELDDLADFLEANMTRECRVITDWTEP